MRPAYLRGAIGAMEQAERELNRENLLMCIEVEGKRGIEEGPAGVRQAPYPALQAPLTSCEL
ncbi:MAG: hypothetical protein R3293_27785 [Candidatus Promineifilaceae bacterium]|nr:hypothetical protein [Candidatus Promineifilaceae bacterium]